MSFQIQDIEKSLIGSLNLLLVVMDSTQSLEKRFNVLKNVVESVNTPTKLLIGSIITLGVVLKNTMPFASDGTQMAGLVEQSGMATESFQTLANATEKYGGKTEETAKSLETLRNGLADIQKGEDSEWLKDIISTLKMDFGYALGLSYAI